MNLKRIMSVLCPAMAAIACIGFASCDKHEKENEIEHADPVLTISSDVSVPSEGGRYSFAYIVTDPADNAEISCMEDVTWITDIDASTAGTVSFTAAENASDAARSGHIILIYTYPDGYVKTQATVSQDGVLSLSVDPQTITAGHDGGVYSFSFRVANSVAGGNVNCSSDVDWIGEYDYTDYGTIKFRVDGSSLRESRNGEISITYTYSGGTQERIVTVTQNGDGHEYGDIDEVIGTYTASGSRYYMILVPSTWTMKIYANGEDLYIDGWVSHFSGSYDSLGNHSCSVTGYYRDGQIVIPSQVLTGCTVTSNDEEYHPLCTPVTSYDEEDDSFSYSSDWPDITFTYDEAAGTWASDYGLFYGGTATTELDDFSVVFEAIVGSITLQKTSSKTE